MGKEDTSEMIALVDEKDRIVGYENKLKVHQEGLLHRAFSVVVINSKGQWLLHRRALDKYHSGGSWTNACCSHLTNGDAMAQASKKRLLGEMGIDAQPEFVTSFHYRAEFDNGLIENEIDHVYMVRWDGDPDPDPAEVMDWKWMSQEEIEVQLASGTENFSVWFPLIYKLLKPHF
jgi:isopentenyl-diphosphate delta-isomerase